MADGSVGRALHCQRCGSAISTEALGAEFFCPYCGHRQSTANVAASVHAYEGKVQAQLDVADHDYERAAQWQSYSASTSSDPQRQGFRVVTMGLPLVAVGVGIVLSLAGVIRPALLPLVFAGTAGIGAMAYMVWNIARQTTVAARQAAPGELQVSCPNCGAPGMLTAGQGIDACRHCGASLIPSKAGIQQGLDQARQATLAARIAHHRAERLGKARVTASNYTGLHRAMTVLFLGALFLLLAAAVVGYSVLMALGRLDVHGGIILGWVVLLAALGPGGLYLRAWLARKRAWRAALEALTRQFGGAIHRAPAEWVQWLNTYWIGDFNVSVARTYEPAAALEIGGFPALVVGDAPDKLSPAKPPLLEVLLAAWVPGHSDGSQKTSPSSAGATAKQRLIERGLEVSVGEAGVRARAGAAVYKQLYRHPAAARELAPILTDLSTLATSLGAEPMPPISG
jgi:uncharacterized Zn finger protein (UPF0148 family)